MLTRAKRQKLGVLDNFVHSRQGTDGCRSFVYHPHVLCVQVKVPPPTLQYEPALQRCRRRLADGSHDDVEESHKR